MASLSSLYSLSPMSLVAFTLNWYEVKGFRLRNEVQEDTSPLVINHQQLSDRTRRKRNAVALQHLLNFFQKFLNSFCDSLSFKPACNTIMLRIYIQTIRSRKDVFYPETM